jgi:hypothetical protein
MHKNFKTGFWVLPLALIVSTSIAFAKKPTYTEIEVVDGGSINGTVTFKGSAPAPVSVNLKNEKNSEFCLENAKPNAQGELLIQHVELKDGNLKDAVVYIQNIDKGKPWANETLDIHFRDCQAFPKVAVVRKTPKILTNNLVTIENHDSGVLHNPKGFSIGESTRKIFFKKWLLNKGAKVDVTKSMKLLKKKRDSHFYIECEQHLWMSVSTKVVWNPYQDISKRDGSFKIDRIPPGHYKVVVWHPYVGEKTIEVDISSGGNTQLDLTLP